MKSLGLNVETSRICLSLHSSLCVNSRNHWFLIELTLYCKRLGFLFDFESDDRPLFMFVILVQYVTGMAFSVLLNG